jgi:UDP-N-acetylglucosamine--dolichyl-phosphate N-acetylglucosaminephosphotransferase
MEEGSYFMTFLDVQSLTLLALLTALGFVVVYLSIPPLIKAMRKRGITGIDAHKISKPTIPEMGGIAIIIGIAVSTLMAAMFFNEHASLLLAFLFVILLTALVGVYDDLKGLNPVVKPVLIAAACLPLYLFGTYPSHLELPFVKRVRLTMVYPLMLPFAVSVPANAVNMMDVLNGSMSGSCLIVLFTLLMASAFLNKFEGMLLCSIMIGSLMAFHLYNRYPAKIFSGDVGSLIVGAGIGSIVVMSGLEVVGVVAMLAHITNAFSILSGLKEFSRHESWPRPTRLQKDGKLIASDEESAPITLVRVITAKDPMDEREVVRVMYILTTFNCLLALVTAALLVV